MYRRVLNFIATAMYSQEPDRAQRIKLIWALAYGFLGWNAFTMLLYTTGKDVLPQSKEDRVKFMKKLTGENGEMHSYRVQGMTYLGTETVSVRDGKIQDSDQSPTEEGTLENKKSISNTEIKWPSTHLITRNKTKDHVEVVVDNLSSEH